LSSTASTTVSTARTAGHPAVPGWLHLMLGTGPGLFFTACLAVAVTCLFWPPMRKVAGPVWRLLTGGLVFVERSPWQSTWLRPAPERPENRPNFRGESYPLTRWGRLPGWRRMVLRWGVTIYVCVLSLWPLWTVVLSVLAAVAVVVRRAHRELQQWAHHHTVGAFAAGAAEVLQRKDDPLRWIAIPRVRLVWLPIVVTPNILHAVRGWLWLHRHLTRVFRAVPWLDRAALPTLRVPLDDDDARILVSLDARVVRADVIAAVKALRSRLPDGPWKAVHHERDLTMEFSHPERPPARVEYSEEAYDSFPVDEVPIAQSAGCKWETLPLRELTPHGIVSATTGWGKTTVANVYIAHTAGHGGKAFINDPKRVSYTHFSDCENIIVRTTADGYAATLDEFLTEMERRYGWIERFPIIKRDPELYFQPWFLVTDERGSFVADLCAWAKEQGDKSNPPAVLRGEKKLLWQMRMAAMYEASMAQQSNREVFIDTDGRDQRMWRIASGPQTATSFRMLFNVAKIRVDQKKGRALLGIGVDSVKEVQLALISEEDAVMFARRGVEIAKVENEARAKRLAALLAGEDGQSTDAPLPEETSVSVRQDTPDTPTVENPAETEPAPVLRIIPGQRQESSPATDVPSSESTDVMSGQVAWLRPQTPDRTPDTTGAQIVGLKSGAEFLGLKQGAFEKRRLRRAIRGEYRVGIQPAWKELDLKEWANQGRRTGGQA
jgi:hypothetical protein